MKCSLVFSFDDPSDFILVLFLCLHQVHFCSNLAFDADLERALSPPGEGFLHVCVFEHVVQVFTDSFCVLVQKAFSRGHTNPSKHFDSQCPSCDCADHIDCVLFSSHIVSPSVKNIPAFFNVNVIFHSRNMSLKSFVELSLHPVPFALSCTQLIVKSLLLRLLLLLLALALSNKLFPCVFFENKLLSELVLDHLVVGLGPLSECFGCVALYPVSQRLLQ